MPRGGLSRIASGSAGAPAETTIMRGIILPETMRRTTAFKVLARIEKGAREMTIQRKTLNAAQPIGALIQQFCAELARLHYRQSTIHYFRRSIGRLAVLMKRQGVAPSALTRELAVNMVRGNGGRRDRHDVFIARRFADHLVDVGVRNAPAPAEGLAPSGLRGEYENYLRRHRALSERTIQSCWQIARRFLEYRFGGRPIELSALEAGDIIAFLQQTTARRFPYRDKTLSTHLRNFFQFLFMKGTTRTNLSIVVPKVAQRYGQRLPRYLTPEQVETVLAAVRRRGRFSRRDYAMVLLLARLGLRAHEVVTIQLEDLDWRAGELVIRGKGGRLDRLPLPPDVGEALVDYIRHDRVSPSRMLFVRGRAPHGPFKDGQVLNFALRNAFAQTGVKPPCPYVGSHVLRHSLATNLVRKGAPLAEISEMLRHRSRASTLIYARLDVEGLRSIAQPWPSTQGAPRGAR
jgi:site-specific recombinase XerD